MSRAGAGSIGGGRSGAAMAIVGVAGVALGGLLCSAGCRPSGPGPSASSSAIPAVAPLPDLASVDPIAVEMIRREHAAAGGAPRSAAQRGRLAMALHANGLSDAAVSEYRAAEALDPADHRWPHHMGRALRSLGHIDPAIDAMKRAAAVSPRPAIALAYAGLWNLERGDLGAARRALERAATTEPTLVPAHLGLAQLAIAEGRPADALPAIEQARRLAPGDRYARYLNGLVLRDAGRMDDARIELAVGAGSTLDWSRVDPLLAEVQALWVGYRAEYAKAQAMMAAGQIPQAQSVLRGMLARAPGDVPAATLLAGTHVTAGRPDDAIQVLTVALRETGEQFALQMGLASAHAAAGRPEVALRHAEKAVELNPTLAAGHRQRARLLALTGRTGDAIDAARCAAALDPSQPDGDLLLVELLIGAGERAEATRILEQAILRLPGRIEPCLRLAAIRAEEGQPAAARALLEHVLRIDPANRAAQQGLAALR